MTRQIIRVEPLSTYLERWKAPTSAVTRSGDTLYVSGLPPFDPGTGEVIEGASIERQTELVLEQLKLCLQTAGSSLDNVLKCTVYCTSVLGDGERAVEIVGLDQEQTGEVLLAVDERPVGQQHPPYVVAQRRRRLLSVEPGPAGDVRPVEQGGKGMDAVAPRPSRQRARQP
jgi:enamine deaminase RidA (YjgF/YER057c/UK114 family)